MKKADDVQQGHACMFQCNHLPLGRAEQKQSERHSCKHCHALQRGDTNRSKRPQVVAPQLLSHRRGPARRCTFESGSWGVSQTCFSGKVGRQQCCRATATSYVSQARIGTNKPISFLGHPCAARMELTRRSVPQPACCPSKSASQGLRLLLFSSARLYTTCRAGARAQTPPYACSPHSRPTQRKPA